MRSYQIHIHPRVTEGDILVLGFGAADCQNKGDPFIQSLESREDVSVIEIHQANRDTLVASLIDSMR